MIYTITGCFKIVETKQWPLRSPLLTFWYIQPNTIKSYLGWWNWKFFVWRHYYETSPSQRSGWSLADWFLNPGDILGCSDCYQRPRWGGTHCSMIFTIVMSIKVPDHFESFTPVWKCVEIELPSASCLNNLERQFRNIVSSHKRSIPSPKA